MEYRQLFGAGPSGILATVLIWTGATWADRMIEIPAIPLGETFRAVLLALFLIDAGVTVVWSLIALPPKERGREVVKKGPFRWVRHPLYSAFIWSGTGAVAIWFSSWTVLFSVVPVSLFWAWHIRGEEAFMLEKFGDEYKDYMDKTGQFFPRFGSGETEQ